jgi:tripartite ATP-independent transporter DctM subunit
MIGGSVLLLFVALLLAGVPVAFALLGAGTVGLVLLGAGSAVVIVLQMYEGLRSFPLVAIPLFLLMANLMEVGGVTNALVRFATSLVGHLRGSLAIGNVGASTLFAGISGSCLADTTAVGSMMIPAMIRQGYPPAFAGAVTAAANIVGPIIPPSILMILYGYASGQSVIKLFLGGIIPGLMLSLAFGFFAWWVSAKEHYGSQATAFRWAAVAAALGASLPALVIPAIIVSGVVLGVFTVTESAGAAAVYALLYAIAEGLRRPRGIPWRGIVSAFGKTAHDTAVVLLLVAGSHLLGWVLTMSQLPQSAAVALSGFGYVETLLLVNLVLLVFGMFLEPAASVLIATSILIPIVQRVGVDLIHFGIIMVVNLQIGVLTPPVASAAFVTSRIAGISFEAQIRALVPFIALGLVMLLLVTYVPALSLWIPGFVA